MISEFMTASVLRDMGRDPAVPFRILLDDGSDVVVERLLRILPGRRIVGEGQWNGLHVLAKLFVSKRSAKECADECSGIDALTSSGIPTPKLLEAKGLQSGGHVLLTEFLPGAENLAEAWNSFEHLPAGHPAGLAALLPAFSLLGRMHASNLAHMDLHLGNFLLHDGNILIVDGDAVTRCSEGGLPRDRQLTDLADLVAEVHSGWEVCLEALLSAYNVHPQGVDGRELLPVVSVIRRRRLRRYLSKTTRDCTEFSVRHSFTRFESTTRSRGECLSRLLKTLDVQIEAGFKYKDGGTCTVARVETDEGVFVLKRYNIKGFWHALSRCWRVSRAWHSWRSGHLLKCIGIATPEPVGLIEERLGWLRRRAYLITEYCSGKNLLEHLSEDREPEVAEAAAVADLFDTLHREKVSHGDLKGNNLLWSGDRIVLIDLDALRQHRSSKSFKRAWQRDRDRLLRNWPASSVLYRWLDKTLPQA